MANKVKEEKEKKDVKKPVEKKKKKKEKINPIAGFEGATIDLKKFDKKSSVDQQEEILNLLKDIYKDNIKVNRKHAIKVIKVTLSPKDNYIYLPHNLKVSKEGLELKFSVERKKDVPFGWIIFAVWTFIFALIAATYTGVMYLSIADLNKDIDGDGIPDINIDINNDRKAEINIDTNGDDKPDLNIDYKGNRKAIFNIDADGDGIADYNLVFDASAEGAKCTLNCDTNGDGWPDVNVDLDGDGVADTDIDTDGDGVADLNIDLNGDNICDVMCDTDGDGICDVNCIKNTEPSKKPGTSQNNGDPETIQGTATIIINFIEGETVNIANLVPDDQPYYEGEERVNPRKTFTIENIGTYAAIYSLKWTDLTNTFTSNNFKFKLDGTNGAPSFGYTVAPKEEDYIVKDILIPAKTSQKYVITFNLEGVNGPQNYDQNRTFTARIEVEL